MHKHAPVCVHVVVNNGPCLVASGEFVHEFFCSSCVNCVCMCVCDPHCHLRRLLKSCAQQDWMVRGLAGQGWLVPVPSLPCPPHVSQCDGRTGVLWVRSLPPRTAHAPAGPPAVPAGEVPPGSARLPSTPLLPGVLVGSAVSPLMRHAPDCWVSLMALGATVAHALGCRRTMQVVELLYGLTFPPLRSQTSSRPRGGPPTVAGLAPALCPRLPALCPPARGATREEGAAHSLPLKRNP